jgi:hypothetical protein
MMDAWWSRNYTGKRNWRDEMVFVLTSTKRFGWVIREYVAVVKP